MSSMVGQQSLRAPQPSYKPRIPGYETMSTFSPEQKELFQRLFEQVGPESYLSRLAGGDQSQFAQMEAPALRQFGELAGGAASRFSGMGGLGARRSSGFQNYLGSAGSDLAERLQSQRMGLQRQALTDLLGISEALLSKQPYAYMPKKRSFLEELGVGLAGGIGQGLGGLGSLGSLSFLGLL